MDDYDSSNWECFKYRVIDKRLVESLINSHMYFAPPKKLNDPYDCQVNIEVSLRRAFDDATDERKEFLEAILRSANISRLQEMLLSVGVVSFSKSVLIPTVWSHYAHEHRGICLFYDFPFDFINDPATDLIGATRVKYGDNKLYRWLMRKLDTSLTTDEALKAILKRALSVKGAAWSYEKESRFIRRECGLLEFDRTYLKQVCFGLRTPEKDRELVRRVIDMAGYSGIVFAEINRRTDFDFRLRIDETL